MSYCFTSPFTSPSNEAAGRPVTSSLYEMCLPWLVFNLLSSLCALLLFPAFDFNRPNNNLISFFHAIYPRLRTVCGQTGTSTQHAAWHSLMKVSGPLHAHGCFHWVLTYQIPSSLLLSPQTDLLEGSVMTPCLILSYQVNMSCSH